MANNIIKGRKGGGSKQRTPTEQPDDLQSVAKAKILLALGEGEFAGGLTGKDIYLDGTPLENADGSQNFSGVSWEFRPGTQAQTYIQGIPGTENEISVGSEVSSKTAWTHTFTNTQLSAVRVRLKWPSLMKQEDDGDVVGNTVKYAIDLQTDGGAWQTVLETAVTGKTTSGYERSHRIDLPHAGSTWTLRLRKISPDANSVKVGDVMTLQSYTEVIDAKLRYPNTALLYIEFDSSQFNGSIPQISCEPRGRVIRVPDNYNPETREYTGVWTGGFKWAWTDNPAWIYYDIVIADRFGLGNRLSSVNISKWTLYQIAQYCDQLVPDGRGGDGMEPRYTCNVYVQERNDAYTVLRDFAAIFRGMTCWNGEQIVVQADMPRDVDFTYTRANIVGKPRYSSSSSQVRYTNALVSWSDPDNAYADAMEPAFIPELVSRYSFNQLEMTAIGCTRQSEAHRKGLWGILTNNKDRVVEFDVGLDGRIPQPGYIIALADELLAGRVNGGRISVVNGRVITLDRDVDAKPGDRLQLNLPSGISQSRTIQAVNGRRQITVTTAYSETPERECVWAVESDDLFLQQYRVTGVKENSDATLTITGVAHDPDKFARIDTGAVIDQRPVSVLPAGNQSPPDDIVITSRSVVNQGISVETMQVNWSAVSGAISYEAQWRRNEGNWISVPRNSTTSFEVSGIYAGRYLVRVRAINAAEISSGWAYSEEKTLTGKVGEPLPPLALTTASLTAGIEIRWEFPEGAEDTQRTELQYSPDQDGKGALPLTDLAYPGKKYQQMGLKIATQFWYRARLIDRLGNASPWTGWVHGMSSDNVDDYYQQLDDAIKDTDTYEELTGGIKEVSDSAQAAKDAAQAAQVTADGAVATNKQQKQQLNDLLADIQQNAKDITDAANAGAANAGAIAQEILDRQAGDLATANKAASDVADAIAKAETDDAEVAAQAAANLLATKNEVEAQISTTNTTMQDGFDSLAQQMASIAAGTGEQFDSLKIWYFEKDAEGWASDDSNINILPVDSDGWIYPAGASSTMRSPNPLAIDGQSYKYIRLRMKRVGNPAWAGRLYWIGVDEKGWESSRSVAIPAPDFDPATGISVVSIPDLLWANSGTIRRLRLDFSSNQDADNFFAVDWMAVGRPTPGASQAQIQDLKTAMTAADSAEAAARNTLAVQLRGNYEGTDPAKLVTGIIYNERQTRVTAEQAISSDVNTLRTDYNANKAAVTQRLDTLTSENQSQAQALTQLQSGLTDANGKIGANTTAINQLKTDVSDIDGRVTANSSLITGLESTINNDAIALVANPNNLLTNTGFERDKAAWTGFNAYADIYAAQVPHSGAKILRGKAGGIAGITQLVANVKKGRTYRFGGYVKRSSDMTAGAVGNNKFRLGNADTGAGPLSELNYTQSNVGTNWTLLTKDYVPSSDMTLAFSINWILNSGEIYFDDVFFVDVTDEINNAANASAISGLTTRVTAAEGKISTNSQSITQLKGDVSTLQGQIANKADASALQQLQTTVSQQGDKLASQGSAITELQNTAQNGKAKYWLTKIFDIKVSGSGYIPKLSDLSGVPPLAVSEMADAAKLDFLTYGDYKIAYAKSLVYLNADKTIEIAPGSRIVDDTGRLYVNGVETASFSASATKYSLALKKGWNTIEFVVANITGQFFINLGLKLSDNVDQLFSGAGQMAAASAAQVISSQVEQTAGKVDANSSAILTLNNSVKDINTALNNKADASALQSLTTRVSNAEGKIASQGQSITQLTNSISNTESAMDAQGKIPGNLLANASFERGQVAFDGWSDLTDVIDATNPHSGGKILRMNAGAGVKIGQSIEVTQGRRYRFGVFARQNAGTEIQDPANTKFRIADGSDNLLAAVNYGPFTNTWQHVSMDWTASKNTVAKFQLTAFLKTGTMYFDDVYVVDITNETNIKGNADAITSLNTKVTQQGNDITSQSNAITNLSNSLKTQQYANSNPWIDGSFESYSDGQALSGANAVVTTEYAFSGSKSLKCRRADGETGNSDKGFGNETAIRENAVYRFECWAMMPEGERPPDGWGCNVGMTVRTAAGTAAWPTAFAINEAALTAGGGRGKWVKFSGKLVVDGKQKTRGRLWISTRGTAGGPGYRLYIDDLVITDVTDAHAAQTTADANSSAISGLTSRVTSAEGKITAQADSITKLTGEINTINGTLSQKADASAVNALQSRVTTAEGKIESQGTAITQLTNGLEAYRRTGENLVQNFDFLQGDTAYNVQNASKVTFGDYGDGKVGVRMVRTDGNSPGIFANNKKPIPQNGQRRYRYVVRAKGVSGAMNLLMRRWNFNGTVEGPGVDKNFTLTTSWQTLTWETDLTPATGVDGSAFGLYCHPSNAEIWIDSFKVYDITEEVTIKANSDALSTLTSTVTQNGKDIAAQASALTQLKSSLTNDAVALATNPNNMVANSGFERGTDNWSGFNAYADIYAAQSPRTGAYIMRGLSGGNVAVSQVILGIKKGRTYRYGGYMRRDSNTTIGNQGNNKFRIGNADTGAGPIHQVEYSQSNVGTSWTLITGDWVPASDQNIAFSINVLLTAGNFYFDDIFFVDVTDEINNAANATAITNLTTRVTSAEGKITSQGTAITQLTADLSTANGKITANANAITSLQSTVTQQGNTLTTQGQAITKLNSDLSDLSGVVDTKASASAVSQLTTRVTNAEGKITANSTALNSITSRVDDAESAIDGLNETTAANGLAMANGFQQLRAQIGDNQAAITQTNKAVVDLESATAQQIDTINASMDGMSATVQQTSTAVADINGKLSAQWGVKVQTDTGGGNPRIAGIQLGIDASGSSQFLVMADTFAVYTGGTNKTYPFVLQNGVAYMQEALIRDGSITNAKIGNEIKSNNFVDGSSGWRIGKDGSSQFNNVIVRGAVYATDGWFQGTVYANRIEGDIGSFAINIAQHRTRKVPKATWQWFELARFRRQNFDQVINIRGGLLQTDSITIDGGAKLRAGMSYSPGSDGGLDPGFLSYAMLLRGTGATSGGGSMEIGVELAYETGGATRLLTAQESMNVENMSFVVPAGTGDAILRYGCYLDRNGQMVLTILSRFDAFSARNNNVIRGSSTP
ncbi:carbohydrate binding domain-containing protein [Klebsiella pneumoniae]|uniref:TipJ family phage tail tip protein n=1 Tax=Klebsiella pneumoniae TaxID=573 RepID=UPI002167D373|nr:carbohydrate binding domain-containing protein [Klebsiella pneumoniae]